MTPDPFASGYRLTDGNQLNFEIANPQWSTTSAVSATSGGTAYTSAKVVNAITNITSASAPGAGITLPQALMGKVLVVSNNSGNDVRIFAEGDSTIDGLDGLIGIILPKGTTAIFTAVATKEWSWLNTSANVGFTIIPNIATLKGLTVNLYGAVFVQGYYTPGDGGGGYFYGVTGASPGTYVDNGGTIILPLGGDGSSAWLSASQTVINVAQFGAKGDGSYDDTSAIFAATAYATSKKKDVVVPAGYYILTGSGTLEVDLGKISFLGLGQVTFDCTAKTGMSVWAYSSLGYPANNIYNTQGKLSGISWIGPSSSAADGIRVGHSVYTSCNQILIESCAFHRFYNNITFESNAWRVVFSRCVSSTALNYSMYAPPGLVNFGESMGFFHCQFNDSLSPSGVGGILFANPDGLQLNFYSCSILNTQFELGGVNNAANFFGGNIENPGSGLNYTYFNIIDGSNTINFYATTITLNNVAFQVPVFNSTNAGQRYVFTGVKFVDCPDYNSAAVVGVQEFCAGPASISVTGSSYWYSSGIGGIVIGESVNCLSNGNLETGDTTGWTITPYGTSGATAVASATAKKNGNYGLLITTVVGGGINITQSVKCLPGQFVTSSFWARVDSYTVDPPGFCHLYFYDSLGNLLLSTGGSSLDTSGTWATVSYGMRAYAPAGAASVTFEINGQPGDNVIYIDDVILNIG